MCYISLKIQPCSIDFMLILLYTFWNVQHLLSKNQRKRYDINAIINLQALTTKYEYFTRLLTYITTMVLYSRDTSNDFPLLHFGVKNINHSQRFTV